MKRSLLRTFAITFITLFMGGWLYYQSDLEITFGLDKLFQFRGVREPPPQVVIAAMDEKSESRLGVSWNDYTEWRKFHAQLLRELQKQGSALIVFDLNFIQAKPDLDKEFIMAIKQTGNVLVTECVSKLNYWSKEFSGREQCSKNNGKPPDKGELQEYRIQMERYLPTPAIAKATMDHAPFYLPDDAKSPSIHETWTFISRFGDAPTLPVISWLHYLQGIGVLKNDVQPNLPLSSLIAQERRDCLNRAHQKTTLNLNLSELGQRVNKLICNEEDSQYIDFYGPPKTLRMESYIDVYDGNIKNLKGKVVFIGKANLEFISGKTTDVFHSPFTTNDTGQMFGIEIMATQFANLLEGRHIESPLPPLLFLFAFSMISSLWLSVLPNLFGMALSLAFSAFYAISAWWCFGRYGWWLPVAIPLFIQLPSTWLLSLLCTRRDLLKERMRIIDFIYQGLPGWLRLIPASPGQWHPEQSTRQLGEGRDVFGVCLATDIQGYTPITSHLPSREVWKLLEAYYQALGLPVSSNNGIIANVQGDAMIALWIDSTIAVQRHSACMAALEIAEEVGKFNSAGKNQPLPTRIGLYEGEFLLACGDAGKFRYFNPFGNTINSASRIEGVNKYLGTKILATEAIVRDVPGIIYRAVGGFKLVGLDTPIELTEIMAKHNEHCAMDAEVRMAFAAGLTAFKHGLWQDAFTIFEQIISTCDDGPSRFYLNLATSYLGNPPSDWQGFVNLTNK